MEWVPLNDYDNGMDFNDFPRKLTQEEILYITDHLPVAPSADSTAAEVSRQGTIEWMIATLREASIAPSAIPELIQRILIQHNKSLVIPGTPIGITAAESVGATTTQMTLNSVAFWEKILIQDQTGNPNLIKIGEWIDELLRCNQSKILDIPENRTQYLELPYPVNILSPNEHGKVRWDKVTAVTRHLPVGDMVKIATRSGREVTATQSKSLLIWDGSKFVQTEGKFAKIGDKVPVFAQTPNPPVTLYEIDLRKFLHPKEWLYGSELKALHDDYKTYEDTEEKFWAVKSRLDNLPFSRGESALLACVDGLDTGKIKPGYIYPKNWARSINTMIPEKITLTKEFGQIIGLYLANGFSTDNFVRINNIPLEILELVHKWCKSIGITCDTSECVDNIDINLYSPVMASFFRNWLNSWPSNEVIPPEVLLGNNNFIIGVLDGYFAGNGTVNTHSGFLSVTSESKDIITGFGFLCSRLGIFGIQSNDQEFHVSSRLDRITASKQSNLYTIQNHGAVVWANTVGSCHNEKKSEITFIENAKKRNTEHDIYFERVEDVMLDPIVSIEYISATEYVYDLTVPTTTNFSLWNGLGIADTFHTSGSAKSASFGIDAMRDLIFARKNPKNESSTIYFTNKLATYEEILDSRHYIVGSVVFDFIKQYDIDSPAVLQQYWWHEHAELLLEKKIPESTKVLRLYLNVPEMYKHHVSIKDLADVLEREVPPSAVAVYGPIGDGIIDFYPHPSIITETLKCREKGVIPAELAELTYLETVVWPELKNIRVKGIAGLKNLTPIVSPVWRMVLLERKMESSDIVSEDARSTLEPYIVSGDGWLLYYNLTIAKMTGLEPENLAALCQRAGITIIGGTQTYLAIAMPKDRFRSSNDEIVVKVGDSKYLRLNSTILLDGFIFNQISESDAEATATGWTVTIQTSPKVTIQVGVDDIRRINENVYRKISNERFQSIDGVPHELIINQRIKIKALSPSDYIQYKVSKDKSERNTVIKRLTDEVSQSVEGLSEEAKRAIMRRPINVPRTPLMIASEFIIAETDGSNLKELMSLPNIDKTRTTCNNMYTISSTLGIEAARTFLIRAIYNTISNTGSYVHPANIMFIAEFITSRGEPYGATYTGISRQPGGHLSLATLERAGKVFTQNALNGRKEDIRNVSASVAVGARMAIGDGSFDIAQDIIQDGVRITVINDDLFTALSRDDNSKRIHTDTLRERANTATVTAEELMQGIEDTKTITLGDAFDYVGAEDQTNLITAFNPGEVIPGIHTIRQPQTVSPKKIVRRVPTQSVQPKVELQDLVSVLDQIKQGIPLPEQEPAVITITPLETTVAVPIQQRPIISAGLIPLEEIFPQMIGTGLPLGLEELFNRYDLQFQQDLPIEFTPPEIVQELPRVEIPRLPDLTGIHLVETMTQLRREQVRNLEPIDTTALQSELNKQ